MKRIVLLIMLLVVASPLMSKSIEFEYNFEKGDVFRMSYVMEQDMNQVIMGQEYNFNQMIGQKYDVTVTDVDENGDYHITLEYKTAHIKLAGPNGNIEYNSEVQTDEEIPVDVKPYKSLINKGFSMVFSPQGEVKSVSGIEQMTGDILDDLVEDIGSENKDKMKEIIQGMFSDSIMLSQMNQTYNIFPAQGVSPGDSWRKNIENKIAFKMLINSVYTFKSINGDVATIDIESKIFTPEFQQPTEAMGMNLIYDLKGSQKGSIEVEIETGWINKSVTDQELEGTIKVASPDNPMSDGMSWPIKMKTRYTVERID